MEAGAAVMSIDAKAAAAWLGGERGSPKRGLPKPLIDILVAGFEAGYWTEDEMVDGTSGDAKAARELWMSIAQDSADEAKKALPKSYSVRLAQWIDAIFVPEEKDETSYVPSPSERKDLDAQAMSAGSELRRLELGCSVGIRSVTCNLIIT